MATSVLEVMQRIAAVCRDAVPGAVAEARFPFAPDTFPYFSVRLVGISPEDSRGQDVMGGVYDIRVRMVIAHIDSGYDGENSDNVYTWIDDVRLQFARNQQLTSTDYPTEADIIVYTSPARNVGPISGFQAGGVHSTQLGVEFSLQYQDYTNIP